MPHSPVSSTCWLQVGGSVGAVPEGPSAEELGLHGELAPKQARLEARVGALRPLHTAALQENVDLLVCQVKRVPAARWWRPPRRRPRWRVGGVHGGVLCRLPEATS